jgi:lipopolysaccharide biosynthesis protein
MNSTDAMLKAIALYLPQFHPIPENDQWWGKGFTEWKNVVKCLPRFPGHNQPQLPADLGFYDLRLPEARVAQAELAAAYGIHGFCYYHYWFNGRRVIERPFNEVLASGEPAFPFLLCWANENWTRRWDGLEQEVLLKQEYSSEDDVFHIRSLLHAFADHRYIRLNGKPVFLVYRASLLPNPQKTAEVWRQEVRRAGLGDLCLGLVQGFDTEQQDPRELGFDFALEFAPDWRMLGPSINPFPPRTLRDRVLRRPMPFTKDRIFSYKVCRDNMLAKASPAFPWYRMATPSWDNSARRAEGATILHDATPELYEEWLRCLVSDARENNREFVFINAWNEWAEGNHLEPCQKFGRAFLEATRNALTAVDRPTGNQR